jgi:hypothetical protein
MGCRELKDAKLMTQCLQLSRAQHTRAWGLLRHCQESGWARLDED